VLVLDDGVYLGLTERTNAEGVAQLTTLIAPHGYQVRGVAVSGCLHLRLAVTRCGPRTVVLNAEWVRAAEFSG